MTLEIPLNTTPSEVLKYKLKLSSSALVALVEEYPAPKVAKSVELTDPAITWLSKIFASKSVGTSPKDSKLFSERNVSKAALVGASTVNSPPLKVVTKSPSAAPSAATRLLKSGVSIAISAIVPGSGFKAGAINVLV